MLWIFSYSELIKIWNATLRGGSRIGAIKRHRDLFQGHVTADATLRNSRRDVAQAGKSLLWDEWETTDAGKRVAVERDS